MSIDIHVRMVLGLRGDSGSGKDTLAALLTERETHFRRALADALKEEVGLTMLNLLDTPDNRLQAWTFVNKIKVDPEVRRLLQAYGESKRNHIDPLYWIVQLNDWCFARALARQVPPHTPGEPKLVVPDVRYPNEIDYIHGLGGALVEVVWPENPRRLTGEQAAHKTETQLRDIPADLVVRNYDDHPQAMLPQLRDGLLALAMRRNDRPVEGRAFTLS